VPVLPPDAGRSEALRAPLLARRAGQTFLRGGDYEPRRLRLEFLDRLYVDNAHAEPEQAGLNQERLGHARLGTKEHVLDDADPFPAGVDAEALTISHPIPPLSGREVAAWRRRRHYCLYVEERFKVPGDCPLN
jgi:hypothetical protein